MPGFLDRLKEGAEKAAFEAERLRRLTQAQSQLRALGRQLDAKVAAMGQQALALYDSGALSQPELLASCEGIDALRQQIADQEAHIEQIREEKPPEAPVRASHGHICPQCQIQLPADAEFCPKCGTKAVDVAPPPPPPPPPATVPCPECGASLPLEALFCNSCGASVKRGAEPEPPEPSLLQICPSCQAEIPAEAIFCPECGQPVVPAPVAVVDEKEPPAPEPPDEESPLVADEASPAEETVTEEIEPAAEEEGSSVEGGLSREDESANTATCESCGATMPLHADFCPECGSPVGAAQSDAE